MRLPDDVQRRLAARYTFISRAGGSAISRPIRYVEDADVIARLVQAGNPDVDSFFVPIARVGSAPLVIRFEPRTGDARAEGIALFRAALAEIAAARPEFVAIHDSTASPDTTADRYRWLMWRTPRNDWVLLNSEPAAYFETKLAALRASAQPDPTLEVAYITRRAYIEYTRGNPDTGAAMMHDALAILDAQPGGAPRRAALTFEVLRSLLFEAARDRDDEDLGRLINRYAVLAAELNVSVPNQPVRTVAPRFPQGNMRPGYVEFEFDVLPDGRISTPRVTQTNLNAAYAASIRDAMREWRFVPAVRDGMAVRSQRQWRFNFAVQ